MPQTPCGAIYSLHIHFCPSPLLLLVFDGWDLMKILRFLPHPNRAAYEIRHRAESWEFVGIINAVLPKYELWLGLQQTTVIINVEYATRMKLFRIVAPNTPKLQATCSCSSSSEREWKSRWASWQSERWRDDIEMKGDCDKHDYKTFPFFIIPLWRDKVTCSKSKHTKKKCTTLKSHEKPAAGFCRGFKSL